MWAYIIGNLCASMGALDPIESEYRTRYMTAAISEGHPIPTQKNSKIYDMFRYPLSKVFPNSMTFSKHFVPISRNPETFSSK